MLSAYSEKKIRDERIGSAQKKGEDFV